MTCSVIKNRAIALMTAVAAAGMVAIGCGIDSDGSAGVASNPTIAPTPTFVVVIFTPTPVPPPTPTPTPRPDKLVRAEFPDELDPYSLNPPRDEESAAGLWLAYLADSVIIRGDGPPIHLCADGRLLSEDRNIREGMTWRVGWSQDMTWEKWWEAALFISNWRGREFLAMLLNATDDEFIGAIQSESDFGLFKSDQC